MRYSEIFKVSADAIEAKGVLMQMWMRIHNCILTHLCLKAVQFLSLSVHMMSSMDISLMYSRGLYPTPEATRGDFEPE